MKLPSPRDAAAELAAYRSVRYAPAVAAGVLYAIADRFLVSTVFAHWLVVGHRPNAVQAVDLEAADLARKARAGCPLESRRLERRLGVIRFVQRHGELPA